MINTAKVPKVELANTFLHLLIQKDTSEQTKMYKAETQQIQQENPNKNRSGDPMELSVGRHFRGYS